MLSALASLGCCLACPPVACPAASAANVCSVASLPSAAAAGSATVMAEGPLPPMLNEGLSWRDVKDALRSRCSSASCCRCRRTYTSSAVVAARLATVRLSATPVGQGREWLLVA